MRSARLFVVAVLTVLVVSAMPASANDVTLVLNPHAACLGAEVQVFLPEDSLDGGPSPLLSSEPEGLIGDYDCAGILSYQGGSSGLGIASYQASNNQEEPICSFRVSQSAICDTVYTVILEYDGARIGAAKFQVLCCPVGGCVQPANGFTLVVPWLAVIGLVGCVATVAVLVMKRRS